MIAMSFVRDHFLLITLIPLMLVTVAASYVRFMVLNDYYVAYEVECDPHTQSCYVGCEDDACTEEYYYAIIERHAPEIMELCGESVLDCEAAYVCPVGEEECSLSFCEPEIDGEDACENLSVIDL